VKSFIPEFITSLTGFCVLVVSGWQTPTQRRHLFTCHSSYGVTLCSKGLLNFFLHVKILLYDSTFSCIIKLYRPKHLQTANQDNLCFCLLWFLTWTLLHDEESILSNFCGCYFLKVPACEIQFWLGISDT
jgi:hypothetical protein